MVKDKEKITEPLVFGLDIGTRSIVGTVGYEKNKKFHVIAMQSREHNDRVMLALRTCDGLDLSTLTDADRQYILPLAQKHIGAGLLRLSGSRLILTRQGLFVSDLVISDLMQI